MTGYSHVLFVDESGLGSPRPGMFSLWASSGIAIHLDHLVRVEEEVHRILRDYFHPSRRELKGTDFPNELKPGVTSGQVLTEIADLVTSIDAPVWVAVSRQGVEPPSDFPVPSPPAKTVARHMLFDLVNRCLDNEESSEHNWLVVWDLGELQELIAFNECLTRFAEGPAHRPRNQRLCSSALGGLSHGWGGLQIADVIAHFAWHKAGRKIRLPDANVDKAGGFDTHLWRVLARGRQVVPYGWSEWLGDD